MSVQCSERVTGIEPAYLAWEASALPLSYTRIPDNDQDRRRCGYLDYLNTSLRRRWDLGRTVRFAPGETEDSM